MPVLFVYGTLRRPADGPDADTHYHHRIADTIDMAEKATLFGAAIYDLGSYPGVGPAESSASVRGEVFELSNEGLAIADEIEGHPTFYERREATIVLDNGMGGSAWVYWAPEALLAERDPLESGDWFERTRQESVMTVDEQLAAQRAGIEGS